MNNKNQKNFSILSAVRSMISFNHGHHGETNIKINIIGMSMIMNYS